MIGMGFLPHAVPTGRGDEESFEARSPYEAVCP